MKPHVLFLLTLFLGHHACSPALAADPHANLQANPHASLQPSSPIPSLDSKGMLVDFIDYTPRGTQPDLTYPLNSSNSCLGCHSNGTLETHYPGNSWQGSMMANATRDPLFWAALDVANRDGEENGAPGIGDFCLRCHTPKGWYGGRVRKTMDVTPVGGQVPASQVVDGANGCLLEGDYDNFDGSTNDYGGIGCIACHRMSGSGPAGEPAMLANADVWIDDVACDGDFEPCRGGPYTYPAPLPGGGSFDGPPHASEFSAFQGSSEACGSCHDVTSPDIEGTPFRSLIVADGSSAGNNTGIAFPAERTYSEWNLSDFQSVLFRDGLEDGGAAVQGKRLAQGESCQSCHMPQPEAPAPVDGYLACFFGPPRNDHLPTHQLVGGNSWIPAILRGEFPKLTASVDGMFDNTIAWANQMLGERSAQVETAAVLQAGNTVLNASVTVTNLAGHKLPTGYGEGRRMWLTVEVRDAANAVIWSNGDWNPADGSLSEDAQTKIYEIKQGIWDASNGTCGTTDGLGREKFHFVLNNCIAKDNRIPPLGFRGGQDPELRAYDYSYPETSPGSGRSVNFDQTNYQIPVPPGAAFPLSVSASLRYQIASRDYIEFLRNQAIERSFPAENTMCAGGPGRPFSVGPQNASRGQYMYDLWSNSAYGRSPPVTMASDATVVAAP